MRGATGKIINEQQIALSERKPSTHGVVSVIHIYIIISELQSFLSLFAMDFGCGKMRPVSVH